MSFLRIDRVKRMDYVASLQELLALKPADDLPKPLLQSFVTSLTSLPNALIRQLLQILLSAQFSRLAQFELFKALVTGFAGRLIADSKFYSGRSKRSTSFLDLVFRSVEGQRHLTAVNVACSAIMALEVCRDQSSVKAGFREKYGKKALEVWTAGYEDLEVMAWMAAQAFPALPLEVFMGSNLKVRLTLVCRFG
jgi:hypothetical protein